MTDLTDPTVAGTPRAGRTRRAVTDKPSPADRLFDLVTLSAGVTVLVLLTLVGVFLLLQGRTPRLFGLRFLTRTSGARVTIHV